MNKVLRSAIALVIVALVVAGCGAPAATEAPTAGAPAPIAATPTATPEITPGGELVMGMNAGPQSLDPAVIYGVSDALIAQQIYDTLVYVDSEYQLHPGLATEWEQSTDGMTFTFRLRSGVTFHDGAPFNAEAVRLNFDRFGNPEIGTGNVSVPFSDYVGTEVLDENSVRVSFGSPKPTFLFQLGASTAGIASPQAIERWGEDFGQHPVGTGPFVFEEWVPADRVTLVRNADYNWAPDIFQHQGPAYLERVVFRFILEDATRIAMLQSGEASVVEEFPAQDIAWLQADPAYYLVLDTVPGLPTVMEMNVERPPTNELAVRQALIYAVDQESLVQAAYFGTKQPAHSVIAPSTLDYDAIAGDMYRYDPAEAERLLEEAGWVDDDSDGVRERNGVELSISYPAYVVWESAFMELLSNMWSEVGFRVDMEALEDAAAWEAAVLGEHNVTNMGAPSFDCSVLYSLFHSSGITGGYNFTRYADPELDRLLEEGLTAMDLEVRAGLYAQVQRLVMEQALAVPVYTFERILAVRAEFSGVVLDWGRWGSYFYDTYLRE